MCQDKVDWAVDLPLKDRTAKLVMIQLCDAWTPDRGCFPSIKRLAARCAASERSVQRALRRLEVSGLIGRQFGARTTTYLLNFDWVSPVTQAVTPVILSPVTNGSQRGDTAVTPGVTPTVTLTIEPEEEPFPLTSFGGRAQEEQQHVSRETDSDDQATVGLGRGGEASGGFALVGETEPDARTSPGPARNGSRRRAGDRERSRQLTLEHALKGELLPLPTKEKANGHRGTRLPADWWPEAAEVEFAQGLKLDVGRIVPEFRDFWAGVAGRHGVKLDWPATFRNRCRALADRGLGRSPTGAVPAARGNGAFYDELAVIAREARERDRDLC